MSDDLSPSSPEVMNAFYRRLYPFKSVFKWLNHEHTPTRQWTNREIAYSLQNDVYLRYQSFANADEFKKQTCTLNPTRFEIGPVYSARPKDKKVMRNTALTPLLRELVFDIDMTDYDSIRTCCTGASICKRCWGFISAAVIVIDSSIREHFGYQHLLWVYSGRRGIHLWVSDREAMELTDEQRRAVVGWMTVVAGGKEMAKKVNVRINGGKGTEPSLPPAVKDALGILVGRFTDLILADQDCFQERARWEELLKLIPDKSIVRSLQDKWDDDEDRTSEEKWDNLKREIQKYKKSERGPMMAALEDIVLQYTYPRIDAEVSKHRNHLLKAPFCVHPKTGRICVPIDPELVDEFDPDTVPTVGQLLQELDATKTESSTEEHSDWEKTSLKPYVDMLEKYAMGLMGEVRRVKREMDTSW
ncbi:prim-pol domain-containing protein [Stereum hirsutum FP-91666 SS1]|uniref:prim-pol domain-containing protein n=1 Tax=Stereum hirsutum (strain FP-91666) TaxID=721885 RepID=UPI000440D652|nr:prim-pol domain-containing protein [Stereum hirsutum FP-91666 SS1]EIM90275.1 prim-pol domain-containing protein [Stereum hirsutum FP-91666 SS1]